MKRLSQEQADKYWEQGYLLFNQPVLTEESFKKLCGIFEDLYENRGDARGHSLDLPHFDHPELLEFLLSDDVLNIVEPLIGPDIGLWSSHFIAKEPFKGAKTPWHEDSSYWEGRFDRFDGIVTVWLAIDKVDEENGAMKVIPGTHENGFSEYKDVEDVDQSVFATEIANVDESKAVTFSLAPNECSLHDSRIIHGAKANTSPRRRAGYTMRYFSQHMKLNTEHEGNKGFKMWHARGENPHNNPVVN